MPRLICSVPHQAARILGAWERFRPTKQYSGLTLEQFRKALQPAIEVQQEIQDLKKALRGAMFRRRTLDVAARELMQRVVCAVRGDPEDGVNCAMYAAMGFVTKLKQKALARLGRRRARQRARQSAGSRT